MVEGMGRNGSVISEFVLFLAFRRVVDAATWRLVVTRDLVWVMQPSPGGLTLLILCKK